MLELELILPCYNEGKSLQKLLTRASEAARQAGYNPNTFQIVAVENGSKDDSGEVFDRLAATELGQWFRVVRVNPNLGYGHGVWQGLMTTTAPFVAWSHADQQCDPNDVFVALQKIKSMDDEKLLIKGARLGRNWKDVTVSRVFQGFSTVLLGMTLSEINAQPKVFPRALLAEIKDPPKNFAFDVYVLFRALKAGYRVLTIPVQFPPRIHGVSNWAANFASRRKAILGMIRYMWDLSRKDGRV